MRDAKFVAFAVVAFLWLSGLAAAANYGGTSITDALTGNVLDVLQIPEDWLSSLANIVTLIIAPFLAVTAIIYGLLTEMRIFRRSYGAWKVNLIISICSVLTSMYLGWFRTMVTFFLAITGIWGTMVFFGLFFIGSIAIVFIRIAGWRGEYGAEEAMRSITDEIRSYRKQMDQLTVDLRNAGSKEKMDEIQGKIERLQLLKKKAIEKEERLKEVS